MEPNQDHPEVIVEIAPRNASPGVNSPPKPMKNTAPQKALLTLCPGIILLGFGFSFKDDCPIDDRIPLLLIITGVLYLIESLAVTWSYFDPQADFKAMDITLNLGLIALWIAGAYFFGLVVKKVNYDDESSKFYCNRNLLMFNYVWYGLYIVAICCICCIWAMK